MLTPPDVTLIERDQHRLELLMTLDADMPCFAGHFDGLPVLAGVVQVGWALQLAERYFDCRFAFHALQSTKFQQLVRPPIQLRVSVQYLPEKQMVKFRYRNALGDCSKGAIRVEEASV